MTTVGKRLDDEQARASLRQRLQQCPEISRRDKGEWNEAEVLTHAFTDLEDSFETFLEELLQRITDDHLTGDELLEVLQEIGEEFRHILYHVKDPKFYRYLNESARTYRPS